LEIHRKNKVSNHLTLISISEKFASDLYKGTSGLSAEEARILEYHRGKTVVISQELEEELSLDSELVEEALRTLTSKGYLRFEADRSIAGSPSFYSKITGDGLKTLQSKGLEAEARNTRITGRAVDSLTEAREFDISKISDAFQPLLKAIDSQRGLDAYEREDLRKKIAELRQALESKNRDKFESIIPWLSKHASFLSDLFNTPDMRELAKRSFGY
jgi:hypothetical protein